MYYYYYYEILYKPSRLYHNSAADPSNVPVHLSVSASSAPSSQLLLLCPTPTHIHGTINKPQSMKANDYSANINNTVKLTNCIWPWPAAMMLSSTNSLTFFSTNFSFSSGLTN
jgi:hypothetical protein